MSESGKRKNSAALSIQRTWRGFVGRQRFLQQRVSGLRSVWTALDFKEESELKQSHSSYEKLKASYFMDVYDPNESAASSCEPSPMPAPRRVLSEEGRGDKEKHRHQQRRTQRRSMSKGYNQHEGEKCRMQSKKAFARSVYERLVEHERVAKMELSEALRAAERRALVSVCLWLCVSVCFFYCFITHLLHTTARNTHTITPTNGAGRGGRGGGRGGVRGPAARDDAPAEPPAHLRVRQHRPADRER
jgi:hypothetical protein